MKQALLASVSIAIAAAMLAVPQTRAEEPFYKGKRLTVLINFAAGGPTDIEGRLFAKFLARNVEGQPVLVVQNMDGAGGLTGAQYLGEVAPKDGTALGYLTGTAWRYASDPGRWRTDYSRYEFLASHASTTIHFVRRDVPPGLKEPADIVKAQGLVGGGLSADASKDLRMRLGLDMLGITYKYVTGYSSSSTARLAMQRNEIHVFAESPPAYRSVIEPAMIKTGEAIAVWVDDIELNDAPPSSAQLEGLGLLTLPQLYKRVKGVWPSGPLWDAYKAIYETNAALTRIVALPPGAPKAAADALRKGIEALAGDKEFAAEATATLQFVPEYVAGPNRAAEIRQMLVVDAPVRAFIADYTRRAAAR